MDFPNFFMQFSYPSEKKVFCKKPGSNTFFWSFHRDSTGENSFQEIIQLIRSFGKGLAGTTLETRRILIIFLHSRLLHVEMM